MLEKLRSLTLIHLPSSAVYELLPIIPTSFPNLESLSVFGGRRADQTPVDLSVLVSLSHLRHLSFPFGSFKTVAPLQALTRLEYVELMFVEDLDGLDLLPDLKVYTI